MKKLRIVSDGTIGGTGVFDAKTGEELSGYFSSYRIEDEHGRPVIYLKAAWCEVDIVADSAGLEAVDRSDE